MSKPLRCGTCNDVVGTYSSIGNRKWKGKCSGAGQHKPPERTEYDLPLHIRKVTLSYPESGAKSEWKEYRGKSKFELWLAKLFYGDLYFLRQRKWV